MDTNTAHTSQEQAQQPALPFEPSVQGPPAVPLPYPVDDAPVEYALTARARRTIAPQDLPQLAVVADVTAGVNAPPTEAPEDTAGDTRPSRARALVRAGLSGDEVAAKLEVDELTVRAWTNDVPVRRRRTSTSRAERTSGQPARRPQHRPVGDRQRVGGPDINGPAVDVVEQARTEAAAKARDEAVIQARGRLGTDPAFAAGLGMLAALAQIDEHGITVHTDRRPLAAAAVTWLVRHTEINANQVRVVLTLGTDVAGDLQRHEWANALEVPLERVAHTRRATLGRSEVEAHVRIPDRAVAATVAAWIDTLLQPADAVADVAF